ncbi:unnamed protein product, partial [Meganyctiphanes norvegica]
FFSFQMAFNANSVMSELTENNSVQNSELPVSAGVITVDSDLRDSVSGVPPQDSDGGDVDTHVTASQLMHMFADFEERMTRKLSCEMSRPVLDHQDNEEVFVTSALGAVLNDIGSIVPGLVEVEETAHVRSIHGNAS